MTRSEPIPLDPDWRTIVNALYGHYGSYKRLLDALGMHGATPDYTTLCHLRSGYAKRPAWPTGAALLNLYASVKAARPEFTFRSRDTLG